MLSSALLLLALSGPGPAPASSFDWAPIVPDTLVTVHGQVVDATTGAPVVGVVIDRSEQRGGAVTDRNGRFRMRLEAGQLHLIQIRTLGYGTISEFLTFQEDTEVTIELEPDPVMLEAVVVEADRLERRRRSVAVASRSLGREEIVTSPAPHMADLVYTRFGISTTPCPHQLNTIRGCVLVRGSRVTPSVYVDEARVVGGIDALVMYRPEEIYRVEVYQRGRQIRVYTLRFMERLASRGLSLDPIPY